MMNLIIPNAASHICYMISRSPRHRRIPPLLMKRLEVILPPIMGRGRRLHKLFGPVQENCSQENTASVFSLKRIAFKNSMHNKRKDKQGKCMPPQQFGRLFYFGQRDFWNHCFIHLLVSHLHDCPIITLSYFAIKTNGSVPKKMTKGVNCHEL